MWCFSMFLENVIGSSFSHFFLMEDYSTIQGVNNDNNNRNQMILLGSIRMVRSAF